MSDKRKLFLKILKVELEETENDIAVLKNVCHERYEKGEITQYVDRENEAFFHHEISCIKKLIPALDDFDTESYQDNDEFVSGLKVFLEGFVKENQFPHAISLITDHKIQKVVKYIF